jgi:magnesium chelatase family protein
MIYQKKASGPLLDRIDLHVEVPRIDFEKLEHEGIGESSDNIRMRIQRARNIQNQRFKEESIIDNSEMSSEQVNKYCYLSEECKDILRSAAEKLHLSARAYYRVLKISRTIADLAEESDISASHVAEALQYRPTIE